ncbi:MAG: hypothetical protein RLZZ210_1295 [Pseudomonadota bacterium]|jgi:tryptophan synthase alpha chain
MGYAMLNTQKNRIDSCIHHLQQQNKSALVTFITAGDPVMIDTVQIMHAMADNGVDIIELGVPFSDPMADGPTIQRSSDRAVRNGINLLSILDMVSKFRQINQTTPIVLMGYANTFSYYQQTLGIDNLASKFQNSGVDGILLVDMPPENDKNRTVFAKYNLHNIYLISPTTTTERIEYINNNASGYIYYVALKGVTGAKTLDVSGLTDYLPQLKQKINLPITVGFGIDSPEVAGKIAKHADGIVIGSKIISILENTPKENQIDALVDFVKSISKAI